MRMKKFIFLYYFFLLPLRSVFKITQTTLFVGGLIVSLIYCFGLNLALKNEIFFAGPKDIESITNWKPHNNTQIFDGNGILISEQFNDYHIYTPFNDIPPKMIEAIIAIEDRKFWNHPGIDIFAILRASKSLIQTGDVSQGASTITQQVVKNLVLSNEKTISRKLREIVLSLYLETVLSKEQIMEIYCNQMFLGFGSYGVAAAAKRYFNKNLSEITYAEAALIAGLFQLPGKYNPLKYPEAAKARQREVLAAMEDAQVITNKMAKKFAEQNLTYTDYTSQTKIAAPYFVDYAVQSANQILGELGLDIKDSGLKIHTSLNLELQQIAEDTIANAEKTYTLMERHLIPENEMNENSHKVEASMLVLERKTGKIVAMVGGRDYEKSQFNRTTQAMRAPGSLFKPITYSLGLKNGKDWNDLYYISPITIGNYRPRTEDAKLFTETTLLSAFYKSVNSPAVTLGSELGMERVIRHANNLGLTSPIKDEAASLLGSSETTMLDIARLYSTFANKGIRIEPFAITKIEDSQGKILFENQTLSKRVLDQVTAELIQEGMKQVITRGTGYKISHLSQRAAGKTGTSNRSKDNWFAGYTEDLVVVTWLGNDDQNPFSGVVSAANTAAPIWGDFINSSIRKLHTPKLKRPRSLVSARVNRHYGNLSETGMTMYFHPHRVPKKEKSDLEKINLGQDLRISLNDF